MIGQVELLAVDDPVEPADEVLQLKSMTASAALDQDVEPDAASRPGFQVQTGRRMAGASID